MEKRSVALLNLLKLPHRSKMHYGASEMCAMMFEVRLSENGKKLCILERTKELVHSGRFSIELSVFNPDDSCASTQKEQWHGSNLGANFGANLGLQASSACLPR